MRSKDTKNKIVLAAVHLFGSRGYDNVSIQEIAQRVGICSGSLYNHFDSKEAVLEAAIDGADKFLTHLKLDEKTILKLLRTETPHQILKRFASHHKDEDDTHRMAVYRLLFAEMYNSPRILKLAYEFFVQHPIENTCYALEVLMKAGAIPRGDSMAIAQLWNRVGIIYGYMAAHNPHSVSWEEYDAMTDFCIGLAVRGVRVIAVEDAGEGCKTWNFAPASARSAANTKERILYQALDLFSRYGYAKVSMRQIAEACGIKASSIYNHFAGKSGIIQEMADYFLAEFRLHQAVYDKVSRMFQERGTQYAVQMFASLYNPAQNLLLGKVYRVLFREQYANGKLGEIFVDILRQDKQKMSKLLQELTEEGLIAPCENDSIATAYIHTMCSLSIETTLGDKPANESYLWERTVALLVSLVRYGYLDGETEETPR